MKHHLLLLMILTLLAGASRAAERPNIVYIYADDLGYGDLAHAGGKAPTPHCDRIAREGMRFTDAHSASAVCTPSRYALLTGRYSWRTHLQSGVLWGMSKPLIPPSRVTVADILGEAGYRTAIVGKWHLGLGWKMLPDGEKREADSGPTEGGGWDVDYTRPVTGGPSVLGFNESFIIPASLDMDPYLYLRDGRPTEVPSVTKAFHRPGAAAKGFEAITCLRDFAREARRYIKRRSADQDTPFFLYLPLTSPHTPIVPSERWQGRSGFGAYGDFLMETDWVVGEVLAELDANGLAENTLVIFTADNGCSPAADIPHQVANGHHPNGRWRGHKADIYEGGHRVPFLVRWPGRIPAGSTSDQVTCHVDLFATCADLVGKTLPVSAAEDSVSMLPAFLGQAKQPLREATVHHSINGSFAIRRGDWKLCLCPGSGGWSAPRPGKEGADAPRVQLFNLATDPAEEDNVFAEHPGVVEELTDLLEKYVDEGRSTPGPPRSNDVAVDIFRGRDGT